MERALTKLKPIERDVLMLSTREGLGLGDIALRLGISIEAVQGHLADALCRIDRFLQRRTRWYWPL
jgi:DNA-directed RNA polymerase specialized sigma24 family protein